MSKQGGESTEEIFDRVSYCRAGWPGLPFYVLEIATFSLEIFLRRKLGRNYLTFPKVVLGILFLNVYWVFSTFGISIESSGGIFTPGLVRWVPHFELPPDIETFGDSIARSWKIWTTIYAGSHFFSINEEAIRNLGTDSRVAYILAIIPVVAHFQLLLGYLLRRFGAGSKDAWSSGKPLPIFMGFYRVFNALHFRGDMVKMVIEPTLCFVIGNIILSEGPDFWLYLVGVWLYLGSFALFTKAVFENWKKTSEFYQRSSAGAKGDALSPAGNNQGNSEPSCYIQN
ncbi:MAG: hypothetical protein CMO55_16960 [Verrucomicrobiales bacterium]|nr:hypothetical protein [Verrucomicrobiales bacterium]